MSISTLFETSFIYALIIGALIGGVAAYIGSLMLTNRMTLMAGALGHLALPGMALALLYDIDVSVGAFLFLIIGISIIWLLEKMTGLPVGALTGVVFTSSVALAFLFLPEGKSKIALLGDISNINFFTCTVISLICIGIALTTYYIFNRIILIGISRDIAQVNNISVAWYNLVFLACIASIVALGVRIVGGLMTAALIAIPASTSRNLSKNLSHYIMLSIVFGALPCIIGIIISHSLGSSVGPTVILSNTFFFLISLVAKIKR